MYIYYNILYIGIHNDVYIYIYTKVFIPISKMYKETNSVPAPVFLQALFQRIVSAGMNVASGPVCTKTLGTIGCPNSVEPGQGRCVGSRCHLSDYRLNRMANDIYIWVTI